MPKHARRDPVNIQRRTDPEVRASAARIVDILQQLVLARPEIIIPLEEIVRGILVSLRVSLVTQMWKGDDERPARGRTPLPQLPLSELPAMLALLERPATKGLTRKRSRNNRLKRR